MRRLLALALLAVLALGLPTAPAVAAKDPQDRLADWLESQVGPVEVKEKKRKRRPPTGDRAQGGSAAPRLAAAAADSPATTETLQLQAAPRAAGALDLVRSFDIPASDPDYTRLANLSWTYDNALAALAFTARGDRSSADVLLGQLADLQAANGSLAFAYDVRTGAASGQIRSNALAWVGIAAVAYRDRFGNSRYDPLIAGLADYLLKSRRSDGLVLGGPDVQWVSTQHNLLMAEFFRSAAAEVGSKTIGSDITGTQLANASNAAASSIVGKLLAQSGSSTYFVQGLNDTRIPLDVQTLGSVFLRLRGDGRATQVATWFQSNLYVAPRVVGGITWSGYKPFASSIAPNVIWSEGTIQADWALRRLGGLPTSLADAAVFGILGTTAGGTSGPKGADRTVNDRAWGEFPGWPTSAAGSWLLILGSGGDVLFD